MHMLIYADFLVHVQCHQVTHWFQHLIIPTRHYWFAWVSCNPNTAAAVMLPDSYSRAQMPKGLCVSESSLPFLMSQARDISCHHSLSPSPAPASCSEAAERTQPGGDKTLEISVSAIWENGEKYEGSTGRTSESCFSLLPWQRAGGSGSSSELFSSLPMTSPILVALEEERCPLQPGRPGSSFLCQDKFSSQLHHKILYLELYNPIHVQFSLTSSMIKQ